MERKWKKQTFMSHVLTYVIFALGLTGCASAESNINSGLWHYEAGLFVQAAPRLLRAIPEIEASSPADPRVVTGYLALGRMSDAMKAQPETVEGYYEKARKVAGEYHTNNSTISRNVATEIGNHYLAKNQYAKALPFLMQAVKISEGDQSVSRLIHAIDLDNIAVAQGGLKNFDIAAQFSKNATALLDNLPDSKEVRSTKGVVLFNRAAAYADHGLLTQADESYRYSLELLEANGERWKIRGVVDSYAKFLRSQLREREAEELERRFK